jgi:uncharacterized protein (DUF305 family)
MKTILIAAVTITAFAGAALAQTDHQQHGHGGTPQTQAPAAAQPQAPAPARPSMPMGQMMPMQQMMQNMPEQCRAMMRNMSENCMAMMMQGGMMGRGMMGGGTMGGGMMGGAAQQPATPPTQSEWTRAYTEAMDRMHGPMVEALQDPDADVAFVKGMIPHHQSAIDMAQIVLKHGKDEQVKKWANDVIREQEREIAEMKEWLAKRGR